jgi:hypothetical protein
MVLSENEENTETINKEKAIVGNNILFKCVTINNIKLLFNVVIKVF